ncbi:MAG TPA: hypothetical protein PK507_03880 [bacterium]|nr:hypothetical protein [bacterium]
MEEIYLRDRGGIQPDVEDVMSDELITLLDGINTSIGTERDPRFGEFQQYLSSISEASILKIEPEQMSSGKYADLDLTGGENDDYDPLIDEPKLETFVGKADDKSIIEKYAEVMFAMTYSNAMGMGISLDKDYAPIFESNMMLPEYKIAK